MFPREKVITFKIKLIQFMRSCCTNSFGLIDHLVKKDENICDSRPTHCLSSLKKYNMSGTYIPNEGKMYTITVDRVKEEFRVVGEKCDVRCNLDSNRDYYLIF